MVFEKAISVLEGEKSRVITDPYLSANYCAFKEALVALIAHCLLVEGVELQMVKATLVAHMHTTIRSVAQSSSKASKVLLAWVDANPDIPISFDCYDNLERICSGSLEEVAFSTSDDELDLEIINN